MFGQDRRWAGMPVVGVLPPEAVCSAGFQLQEPISMASCRPSPPSANLLCAVFTGSCCSPYLTSPNSEPIVHIFS